MDDVDYKKLYYALFNKVTDAISAMEQSTEQLKQIQRDTEELYLQMGEMTIDS